ncbi:MAG: hypothetical protein COX77_01485 [Candidatus Komeilibacteria bacterium CG_4_10_14_0_2_um_filter_37_10]|uniref:Peptidase MA-like domain-containing protein n=1 Tax=Candidatus Komeilibacteria bacterium CG_4_10_14_0_2_um_filter_37_10 TaxID=1974470 RepID=A0A2M7VFS7_9BACT|nr:MAG: hypothetical protein COX77_01485 [Candidatus Komeilibacteria bacterium CG_4_10_14_0_2_um_filter_37_10]
MIKVIYKGKYSNKIKKEVIKAFDFSYKFFLVETSNIVIHIYETRAEFDKQLNMKTADWLVANSSTGGKIDILSPLAMEKESSHNKNEFTQILKHEFVHLFIDKLAKGRTVPKWLNEGLAAYVANQHQRKIGSIFIEEEFCKRLSTPKEWNENVDYNAYSIAALFVRFLINKYTFNKIKKLITSLDKSYYYPNFKKIFFSVYKKELYNVEQLFISEINSR